jgi:hypothetical protein
MIRGYCFTNLDEFRGVEWPERFVAVPRVGECVQGKRVNGPGPGTMPVLKVVRVTHQWKDGQPCIEVELHR